MRKIRKILIFMIVVMLVLSFTTTAFAVPGTVKNGSTGNKVLLCQWIIYTDFDGLSETFVDGICGPNTTSKIKEFQAMHNLEVDGSWGPATWDIGFDHCWWGQMSYFTHGCGIKSSKMVFDTWRTAVGGTYTNNRWDRPNELADLFVPDV